MYWPTTMLEAKRRAMGIRDSPVISGSMFHIFPTARLPSTSTSRTIRKPEP